MDFSINKETRMIKESVRKYLSRKVNYTTVTDIMSGEDGYSKDIWKDMCQLGWTGLIYDECYGGTNGNFFELFTIFEEIGRVQLPSPLFCSVLVSALLIYEGGDESIKMSTLPHLIRGETIYTSALMDEFGQYDYKWPSLEANQDNDVIVLNGARTMVPYAAIADEIIVCGNLQGKNPTLFRVDPRAAGVSLTLLETLSNEKRYKVDLKNVKLCRSKIIGQIGSGHDYIGSVFDKAIVCKCAEMLGGLEYIVDATVAYAKDRHQFGKPIGSLQAVQHHCATMATYLEGSRMITCQAASMLSEGKRCPKEIAMAKAYISQAYKASTWLSHQIHGGLGFTSEYPIHLYYKHAKVAELEFGSGWFHKQKVASLMGF